MDRRQITGVLGSAILGLSVFPPMIRVPFMGNLNYFQDRQGEGIAILVLAVVSLTLVILKKYKLLWLSGMGSIGVLLYSYLNIHIKISQIENDLESELAKNVFREMTEMAIDTIQIEWGLFVLITSVFLLFLTAVIKE